MIKNLFGFPFLCVAPMLLISFFGCSREPIQPLVSSQIRTIATPKIIAEKTPEPYWRYVQYQIYVPTSSGKVRLYVETNPRLRHHQKTGNARELSTQAADEAVRRLLKKSPQSFPPGTKIVKGLNLSGGEPHMTFNREFANEKWWRNSARAKTAIEAIVRTTIHTQDAIYATSGESSLTIFIDGKRTGKLGIYHIGKPLPY